MCPFILLFVSIPILVQNVDNVESKYVNPSEKGVSLDAFLQSKIDRLKQVVSNKSNVSKKSLFDGNVKKKRAHKTRDPTLVKLKQVLSKFLKSNQVQKREVPRTEGSTKKSALVTVTSKTAKRSDKKKEENKEKWDEWTRWSTCSVTCGKGRLIRWRHCLENCDGVETEMQEKTCQLPACPQKLFGIIKL